MSETGPATGNPTVPEERPIWPAVRRGFRRRCPNCGTGQIFRGYLKVRDNCPVCGEELFHQRADDGPAYLTILIVGHILAPLLGITYATLRPEPLVLASVFAVGTVALSLYLLPRLKGMMIAFQWAKYMHGFAAVPVSTETVSTGNMSAEPEVATAE